LIRESPNQKGIHSAFPKSSYLTAWIRFAITPETHEKCSLINIERILAIFFAPSTLSMGSLSLDGRRIKESQIDWSEGLSIREEWKTEREEWIL